MSQQIICPFSLCLDRLDALDFNPDLLELVTNKVFLVNIYKLHLFHHKGAEERKDIFVENNCVYLRLQRLFFEENRRQ